MRRLRASRFVARVTGLGAATVVSQGLGAFALYLLTRALGPADMGTYQVFLSTSALVASVSLLSYQSVLPHLEEPAYRALTKALLVWNVVVGTLTASALTLRGTPLAWAVAAQVLAAGFTSIAEMSNIRQQRSSWIAFARLALSSANLIWILVVTRLASRTSIAQIVAGQVLLALVVGVAYAFVTLRSVVFAPKRSTHSPHKERLLPILIEKRNCPLYYAPAELLGSMTMNLPTLLIERYFGLALAGQFGVVLRFCGAPVTILSVTIGHVYHGALAHAIRAGATNAHANFLKLRRALAGLGAAAGASVFFFVPWLIVFMLGDAWTDAANIAKGLSPMYAVMIWVSPLAASFQVFEAQRAVLLLQLASALCAIVAFVFAGWTAHFWWGIAVYSGLVSLRFLASLGVISRMSRERLQRASQ